MPEKRWKKDERKVARLLNCRRNPSGDPTAPDCENAHLAVEVKSRQKVTQWLVNAVLESVRKARDEQCPVVVVTGPTWPIDLVVIELRTYRDWYVGTPKRERR